MSKYIIESIKVSFREIPLLVKIVSSLIIIYCMYIAIRYGYLGTVKDGFTYPVVSYWQISYGITFTLYVNYIFSIYRDANTSMRELLLLGRKSISGYNYFLKELSTMLVFLIPLIISIIPIYLQAKTIGEPILLIFHALLCLGMPILFMSYALLINTLRKSPILYIVPIAYLVIIDPSISVGYNSQVSLSNYLANYGL
ncbi:MAG: hypothetical protein ACRC68_03875, partial [Clostridium sp.]